MVNPPAPPRCASCPPTGSPCKPCRLARRRQLHEAQHGPKTRSARPRCENCPPTGDPCKPCINAHMRALWAQRKTTAPDLYDRKLEAQRANLARARARKGVAPRGSQKVDKWGVEHKRCDACQPPARQCTACEMAQRAARYHARMQDPEYVARRREEGRRRAEKRRRKQGRPTAEQVRATQRTIARCPECPPVGDPCQTCRRAYWRSRHAAEVPRKAPAVPRVRAPKAPKPGALGRPTKVSRTAEQKEARQRELAEARAAKAAAAAEMVAARKAKQAREKEQGRETLLAEIARETRFSVCQVCQTRGRWEGSYCRRHAPVYAGGR